jgi:beta-mannosidase
VRAALLDSDGVELAHDFHFLLGHRRMPVSELGLTAVAQVLPGGDLSVEVRTQRLARFVTLTVPGYRAEDLYFHLAPDTPRRVRLRSLGTHSEPAGEVLALNALTSQRITFRP